jgi:hypothetical protein
LIAIRVAYFKRMSSILQEVFERCIVNNGEWGQFLVPKGRKIKWFLDYEVCVCVCVCVMNHDDSFFNYYMGGR